MPRLRASRDAARGRHRNPMFLSPGRPRRRPALEVREAARAPRRHYRSPNRSRAPPRLEASSSAPRNGRTATRRGRSIKTDSRCPRPNPSHAARRSTGLSRRGRRATPAAYAQVRDLLASWTCLYTTTRPPESRGTSRARGASTSQGRRAATRSRDQPHARRAHARRGARVVSVKGRPFLYGPARRASARRGGRPFEVVPHHPASPPRLTRQPSHGTAALLPRSPSSRARAPRRILRCASFRVARGRPRSSYDGVFVSADRGELAAGSSRIRRGGRPLGPSRAASHGTLRPRREAERARAAPPSSSSRGRRTRERFGGSNAHTFVEDDLENAAFAA